jgi:hypothetical protein
MLKTMKVFFHDFLKRGDLIADFKSPPMPLKPKFGLPTKNELRVFYNVLPTQRDKTMFLLYATNTFNLEWSMYFEPFNVPGMFILQYCLLDRNNILL